LYNFLLAYLIKQFKGFNISIGGVVQQFLTSLSLSLSLLSTFVACKFSLDNDVIDVCEIEDVIEASNSPPT
jgi:hypothetical protein